MIIEKISKTPLTAYELSLIEETILEEYRARGITRSPESLYEQSTQERDGKYYIGTRIKEMPTLSSFAERLSKKPGGEKLAQILKPYLKGGTMGLFDGQTNIDLKDTLLVAFDFFDIMDEFLKTYALYVVTSWVWEKFVKKNIKQKKFVIVDEAWMFMKYESTANFLENLREEQGKEIHLLQLHHRALWNLRTPSRESSFNKCSNSLSLKTVSYRYRRSAGSFSSFQR